MPIQSCKLPGGRTGFRWGDHGTCYAERSKAEAQGAAAHANGFAGDSQLVAMDRDTVRSYDKVGRLRVELSNISKANVCEYYGREIPNSQSLGLDPTKLYKLLRDPVELAKAVDSFNSIQLLYTHTPVSAADPKKEYVVGCTGSDAVFNPPYLQNSLVFWDNSAIAAIETFEMNQLSSSYHYDADMTPGEYEGEAYDGRMINIVGNHVALVKAGRAGADVVVGDSQPLEHSNMTKKVSAKAVAQRAALGAYLRPALANDAAPIPYNQLLKPKASALSVARATAAHYKDKFEVNPNELSNILRLAADEAEEDDESAEDEEDETEEERKEREAKQAADKKAAKDKAAKDKKMGKDKDKDEDEDDKDAEDEEDEDDNEKSRSANDAALVQTMQSNFKALRQAERDVAPLVGEVVAMDSAEQVYRFALDQVGVSHKGVHASALSTLVGMARANATQTRRVAAPAMDSDARSEFATRYAGASQIKRI